MTDSNILPSGRSRIDSLQMLGITKRFPGVLANDRVDFDRDVRGGSRASGGKWRGKKYVDENPVWHVPPG